MTKFGLIVAFVVSVVSVAFATNIDTSHIYVCVNYQGKVIDYIDPKDWGENGEHVLRNVNHAFKYMPVTRTNLANIKAKVADTTDKYRVDFNLLATAINNPDFSKDFHNTNSKIILKRGVNYTSLIKDKKFVSNPVIIDKFAVSIGDSTVGSGGAYATMAAAFADLANLTGNITFTQISDITETAQSLITENLGGYTFAVTSNLSHNGDPTNGRVINVEVAAHSMSIECEGPGVVDINNLNFKRTANSGGFTQFIIQMTSVSTAFTLNLHNCLFDGAGLIGAGVLFFDNTPTVNFWNCTIWDFDERANTRGLYAGTVNVNSEYENVTIYSCEVGIFNDNQANTFNNFVLFDNSSNIGNNTNSTSNYCATDAASIGAATDNNAQVNLTIANEVRSITDTESIFMIPKKRSLISINGTTPNISTNTRGIGNNRRPGTDSRYSIGAHELVSNSKTTYFSYPYKQKSIYFQRKYKKGVYSDKRDMVE